MKFVKKMLAGLLVCVMAMTMLTACGGGSSSVTAQMEKEMMSGFNAYLGTNYRNEPSLRRIAANLLSNIDENGTIRAEDAIYADEEEQIIGLVIVSYSSGPVWHAYDVMSGSIGNAVQPDNQPGVSDINQIGRAHV